MIAQNPAHLVILRYNCQCLSLTSVCITCFVQDSSGSSGMGRCTPDYGKFYKTTYMDLTDGYKRGPTVNMAANPKHFHRPGKT